MDAQREGLQKQIENAGFTIIVYSHLTRIVNTNINIALYER